MSYRPAVRGSAVKPTAAKFETFARWPAGAQTISVTSGTLKLVAIELPAGVPISSITFLSGTTALSGTSHAWAALFDASRVPLRQSTDDPAATWGTNAEKTFTLSSAFTTTYSGLYYLGVLIAATTPPTLAGQAGVASTAGIAPVLNGNSSTGLTDTAPNPAAAPTASTNSPYAYVS